MLRQAPDGGKIKASGSCLNWNDLLSTQRMRPSHGHKNQYDGRNAFEKDYHRIILSASFRRLQDKTQVFPLDQSDFVRTRLTHSLEVSSLAKSLGEQTSELLRQRGIEGAPNPDQQKELSDLLLCAGLIHDLGNPPFGHYGETTIRNWYKTHLRSLEFRGKPLWTWLKPQMQADLENFEGNAQALRLVSKLHFMVDEHGMNLTSALLNTLIKYPVNSLAIDANTEDVRYHKMGYFYQERDLFETICNATGTMLVEERPEAYIAENTGEDAGQMSFGPDNGLRRSCRHPLTYLLEAADDISYRTADLEDASRKGKITFGQLQDSLEHSERLADIGDEKLLEQYRAVVRELSHRLSIAREKKIQNPELYAIQNWIIFVQTQLIQSVIESYAEHYPKIMRGQYNYDLFHENFAGLLLDVLGDIAYDYVFSSQAIVQLEVASDAIIGGLLDKFVPACINFDTELEQKPVDKRLMDLVSDNYRANYYREAAGRDEGYRLYLRLLLVNDYICGMTDSFAKNLYYKFNGIY
jgi:dGTPase